MMRTTLRVAYRLALDLTERVGHLVSLDTVSTLDIGQVAPKSEARMGFGAGRSIPEQVRGDGVCLSPSGFDRSRRRKGRVT